MSITVIMLILNVMVAHWISDFVLQTSWMATSKSKNWFALLAHVATYTASMFVIQLILVVLFAIGLSLFTLSDADINRAPVYILGLNPNLLWLWVLINGAMHFLTDAITSRLTSKLWSKQDFHNFFVIIGLDQLIHYSCLFGTLVWLTQ